MRLLAIDPGSENSAVVILDTETLGIVEHGDWANNDLAYSLGRYPKWSQPAVNHVAIEYMQPRGMPTSQAEMDTIFWSGRFMQAWGDVWTPVYRKNVKLTICGDSRAKDSNIRQAIIDRYGRKEIAIGGVKCGWCHGRGWKHRAHDPCQECKATGWAFPPGPLYGIHDDEWQALAVALTWVDMQKEGQT